MRDKQIEREWVNYKNTEVIPVVPVMHHDDCEKSYYAGALLMYGLINEIHATSSSDDEENIRINFLGTELSEFIETVRASRTLKGMQ